MYRELALYDRLNTDKDVQEALFFAIEQGFSSISTLPYYTSVAKEYLLESMDNAVAIDFPYGSSDREIKTHGIVAATKRGANVVDVVGNHLFIQNSRRVKYLDEFEYLLGVCKEKKVILRAMIEYRLMGLNECIEIAGALREMGIQYLIPSSGEFLDDFYDNLAISAVLTVKTGMNVISNGNIRTKPHWQSLQESKIYGARLKSLAAIQQIFL